MRRFFLLIGVFLWSADLFCQVGIGTTNPSPASMLDISSQTNGTGSYKGFLPPRVPDLAARNSIHPGIEEEGLLVYVLSEHALFIWSGTAWETIHKNFIGGFASNLFISEYVEGTGNNKAIEIANFTGSSKNLNDYTLIISRNGGTNNSTISFNPNFILNHGEVYVIAHTSASPEILAVANQTENTINFNGNDAVAIRNAVGDVIDVLGQLNVDWNFGEDVTLRRRPLHGPNEMYHPTHFQIYGRDTIDDLGQHTYFP